MRRAEELSALSSVLIEFLECATHSILFIRGVYPADLFERRRKYNVAVRQSRHKELNDYIANALTDVKKWADKGVVEKVVLSIEDAATRKQMERFVFELEVDVTGQGSAGGGARNVAFSSNMEELEDAFRQVLLKIAVADSLLAPIKKETTFSIYVHTATSLVDPNDDWEALSKEGNRL